jgi:hypothetical protein
MDRCVFCQGELDAAGRFCRQCGQMQPERAVSAPNSGAIPDKPTEVLHKACPSCGLELPAWARFCGRCGHSFSQPAEAQPASEPSGALPPTLELPRAPQPPAEQVPPPVPASAELEETLPPMAVQVESLPPPKEEEQRVSGALAGPLPLVSPSGPAGFGTFSGAAIPEMSTAPAWAQGAAPGMPGIPAGPQIGAPGIPGIPAGPQIGAPGVPGMPAGPQMGMPGMPGMAPGAQVGAPGMSAPPAGGFPPVGAPPSGWPQPGAPGMPTPYGGMPSGFAPPVTTAGQTAARGLGYKLWGTVQAKIISLLVATAVVVGGGAATVYAVTRPDPVIQVTSKYHVADKAAGAVGTTLHITGQKFSSSSAITLLIDNDKPLPGGSPAIRSDSNGSFSKDVPINEAWSVRVHTLYARDAKDYSTKKGVTIVVVAPGTAHTPGANGAPPDDASFTINIELESAAFWYFPDTLKVVGQPDPAGGTVCQDRDHGGTSSQDGPIFDANTGQPTGVTYHETITFSCTGSYKSGKLTYVETAVSDTFALSNGVTCQGNVPRIIQSLSGTFSSATAITGTWSADELTLSCTQNYQLRGVGAQVSEWTATATLSV